jgi:pimeloyl-ACP methyl ester carboxylesterase
MEQRMQANQVDLCVETFGRSTAPAILLIHGAAASMGGGIAQRLVLDHPDRVASVTFISTSPGGPGGPSNPDLPPMSEKLQAVFADESPDPDWSDPEAALDALIEGEQIFAGTFPYDEPARRELNATMIARTNNLAAAVTNHWIIDGGDPVRPRLGEIAVPALVLHGTEDPLFPVGHAEAMAREVPGARLVLLEGAGHELPEQTWHVATPEILAVTER